ncbi:MAG TPA: DUF3027 domain-containing protein [Actinophytocola sp.]|uniref:DUF3027 domain-containing protein n=1 Tax=Actinophytocola sp. TaxID=1872138 RepID=UPI002E0BC54D|nr:DUF3027 domain-containing protein [Actinophytocola sp.]
MRQLADAVELAYAAAQQEAGEEEVGEHAGFTVEQGGAVTHLFEANRTGYRGWRWAVTVACAGSETPVTVSEVVLVPGPDALVAPDWVPWQERVQAGDLGVGDLMPTAPDDPRLVPGYVQSDDSAVEEAALELGLGRARVMSRPARLDAAARWKDGEFGPRSDMARGAPGRCGTCGFYLPLDGSLRAAFGVCGNEIAPADGHLVHAEYGCGAHSEAEVEQVSPVLVADLIYDDNALLDLDLVERPSAPEPAPAELSATGDQLEASVTEVEPQVEEPEIPEGQPEPEDVEPVAEVETVVDGPGPGPATEEEVPAEPEALVEQPAPRSFVWPEHLRPGSRGSVSGAEPSATEAEPAGGEGAGPRAEETGLWWWRPPSEG